MSNVGANRFALVRWKSRPGLCELDASTPLKQKHEALRVGVRGKRTRLLVLAAPRLCLHCSKLHAGPCQGRTRPHRLRWRHAGLRGGPYAPGGAGKPALPELSITKEKHEVLVRTAHNFLRERHIKECPLRFDDVAIDNTPGQSPVVRLHKSALSPVVHRYSDWQ